MLLILVGMVGLVLGILPAVLAGGGERVAPSTITRAGFAAAIAAAVVLFAIAWMLKP